MNISGAGVKASNAGVLVDVWESWDGFGDGITTTPGMDNRGVASQYIGAGTPLSKLLPSVGGVLTMNWYNAPGRWLLDYVSAAARVTRFGASTGYVVPFGTRYSDAQSLPIPFMRPLRQYTLSVPVRSAVAGTSAIEIGFATTNGGLTFLGLTQAVVWSSDPAVNAGAWLPRIRQVNAGAITNGTDSGIIPTALGWNLVGLRYTEGPVPTIEWLLNGVPRFTLSGDANMPVLSAIGSPLAPFIGINSPIGRTLSQGPARFTVAELGS